jgi:hypothetical protein
LTDLPANGWVRVEITARLGDQSDSLWNCVIALPGQAPQRFENLKFVSPEMKRLTWVGFSSRERSAPKPGWMISKSRILHRWSHSQFHLC